MQLFPILVHGTIRTLCGAVATAITYELITHLNWMQLVSLLCGGLVAYFLPLEIWHAGEGPQEIETHLVEAGE